MTSYMAEACKALLHTWARGFGCTEDALDSLVVLEMPPISISRLWLTAVTIQGDEEYTDLSKDLSSSMRRSFGIHLAGPATYRTKLNIQLQRVQNQASVVKPKS